MSNPDSKERFTLNTESLFGLIEELVTSANKQGYNTIEPSLIRFVSTVFKTLDKDYVLKRFISKSHKYWDVIRNRDETFLINNAFTVFEGLTVENINAFKNLLELADEDGEKYICDDDKDVIWEHFESLVKISLSYLKEDRSRNIWQINIDKEIELWK